MRSVLIYRDELFQPLRTGERIDGYVRRIRADGRIDLTLQARSSDVQDDLCQRIVSQLEADGGSSTLVDKSPPERIYAAYQVSKKNYKRALGILYRQRIVTIDSDRITLLRPDA